MKFLLDVHIGTSMARALAAAGHDVARAALAYADWSDRRLLDLAVREERIVVTQDSDFSDLIYAHSASPPPAIIYLRCEPKDQPHMLARVADILDSPRLSGHMVVIRRSSTRFRPLPESNDNG